MKRRMLLTLLIIALPLAAQEAKPAPSPPDWVTKVFEVKHQDPVRLVELLATFGAQLRASSALKAVAVTGSQAVVDAVGEAIRRFDVPLRNIELTAHVLAAFPQEPQKDAVPKELDSVIMQLRSAFAYQGFAVVDTMVLRTREGVNANANGAGSSLGRAAATGQTTQLQIQFQSAGVSEEAQARVVKILNLRLSARIPVPTETRDKDGKPVASFTYRDAGFSTSVDVREGQKVVVGKANIDESGTALILVVTAKVVD